VKADEQVEKRVESDLVAHIAELGCAGDRRLSRLPRLTTSTSGIFASFGACCNSLGSRGKIMPISAPLSAAAFTRAIASSRPSKRQESLRAMITKSLSL